MRLPTDGDSDSELAFDTIAAAADAGITLFDTARAYGANEQLVARALRRCGADARARIITKGGMTRAGGAWVPDGRAKALLADCEASLAALDGLRIDLFLIHAPDPRTPWRTSVRALARLLDEGTARHVGLSNVNRRQLEEAVDIVEVTAVEVAMSVIDDTAVRGGLVEFCTERGIVLIAHSPLGGPRRARSLTRRSELAEVARIRNASPEEVALAWLLDLSPMIVAIPGARRPETARSSARAAAIRLHASDRTLLRNGFSWPQPSPAHRPPLSNGDAEVVLVMGIPGAGKSRAATKYVAQGYRRLNRDERGGSMRALDAALDDALASGARRIVLDNTYLTRAARSHVIETAARHRVAARCVWMETPLAQAQVNIVNRLLDRFGALPDPETLRALARAEPGLLLPTNQMRTLRELEPPSTTEGFVAVEQVRFTREPRALVAGSGDAPDGVFVASAALTRSGWELAVAAGRRGAPHLVFDWRPGESVDALEADVSRVAAVVNGPVNSALCPHAAGPPVCWCRPPLPGLILAFVRTHGIDPARSVLIGAGPAHRTLATTLGARYIAIER